jgi:serine/threonine protein kinase
MDTWKEEPPWTFEQFGSSSSSDEEKDETPLDAEQEGSQEEEEDDNPLILGDVVGDVSRQWVIKDKQTATANTWHCIVSPVGDDKSQFWLKCTPPETRYLYDNEVRALLRLKGSRRVSQIEDHFILEKGALEYGCVVLEYERGFTLAQNIRWSTDKKCLFVYRTAKALRDFHAVGWVHDDIKPANIIISGGRDLKLLDLQSSWLITEGPPDEIWGTPEYDSPEKVSRCRHGQASDVWAFGAVTYYVFEGKVLKFSELLQGKQPLPFSPGTPEVIKDLIRHCIVLAPGKRLTAQQVVDRLRS